MHASLVFLDLTDLTYSQAFIQMSCVCVCVCLSCSGPSVTEALLEILQKAHRFRKGQLSRLTLSL